MSQLELSPDLSLPLDVVTYTTAVLGIRGTGKTNTATVLVEEALKLGQRSIVIDPLDVWWGIKSSADGTKPGFPVVVFGGERSVHWLAEKTGQSITSSSFSNHLRDLRDYGLIERSTGSEWRATKLLFPEGLK